MSRFTVHIRRGSDEAKVWIASGEADYNEGFSSKELSEIIGLVKANRQKIEEAWHAHFKQ
ncbi:MAG: DUF4160 domain-containing protein [Rhizobacter sp.]|nr:DUF4160 domain-containing protein [Chlorobiales bacterium]